MYHTHLAPLSIEEIYRFFYCFGSGAHYHNDFLGIRCTIVIEQLVIPPSQFPDFIHIMLNGVWNNGTLGIGTFLTLEIYIGIDIITSVGRMFWVQCLAAELLH